MRCATNLFHVYEQGVRAIGTYDVDTECPHLDPHIAARRVHRDRVELRVEVGFLHPAHQNQQQGDQE